MAIRRLLYVVVLGCGIWGVIRLFGFLFSGIEESGIDFLDNFARGHAFVEAFIPPLMAIIFFYCMAKAFYFLVEDGAFDFLNRAFEFLMGEQTVGNPMERVALEALYWAANGADWQRSDNWLSDMPLGSWYGVAVDNSGVVKGLDLSANGLSGELPSLNLSVNKLSGSIPNSLVRLPELTRLELRGNPFQSSGCIPAGLRDLKFNDLDELGLPFCDAR